LFRKFSTKQPILCTKINVCISKTQELPRASPPGPPPGLCPGPTGGLKATPRPPALLCVHFTFCLATRLAMSLYFYTLIVENMFYFEFGKILTEKVCVYYLSEICLHTTT
jgi:hypothetical protein